MVRLMRSAFPKRGTRISVARTALCNEIEIASARRRTNRSARRCSASPSTRHARREPNPSSRRSSRMFLDSGNITHLHIFFCEPPALHGLLERNFRNLRRRFPEGCSRSPGDRRRARRDVRLRASSLRWTPSLGTSSRRPRQEASLSPERRSSGPQKGIKWLFI